MAGLATVKLLADYIVAKTQNTLIAPIRQLYQTDAAVFVERQATRVTSPLRGCKPSPCRSLTTGFDGQRSLHRLVRVGLQKTASAATIGRHPVFLLAARL